MESKIPKGLNEYQQRDYKLLQELQSQLLDAGFMASQIREVPGTDKQHCVYFFDGTRDFKIHRGYNGNIHVQYADHVAYHNVSPSKRGEIYTKHRSNNVKAISASKVQKLLDQEVAYHEEMAQLETEAARKIAEYIELLKGLENEGYEVSWSKDIHTHRDDQLTGATVIHNGIELEVTFSRDGYVSRKLSVRYLCPNDIATFQALSDNQYLA